MAENQNQESVKLTTPMFRVSFANVFKPKASFQNQEPVYSLDMLFDKDDKQSGDMKWLKTAIAQAANAKWGSKDKWPKNFKSPIKDGATKELEGYEKAWFLTCKSKNKPGIIFADLTPLTSEQDFYSGCFARATVVVKAYSQAGNNGVSVYLQNLQKLKDGAPFSGRRKAEDDFDAIEGLDDSGSSAQTSDDLDF